MAVLKRYSSRDTMEVVRWIEELIDKHEPDRIGIDGIGLGRGVYDRLRELGHKAQFIDSRGSPSDKTRYKNLRAELYWRLAEAFIEDKISIVDDDKLVEQLSMIKRKVTEDIRVLQIISKDDMMYSPNSADALMMCMAFRMGAVRSYKREQLSSKYGSKSLYSVNSWQSS
jgi:hypothetical protein